MNLNQFFAIQTVGVALFFKVGFLIVISMVAVLLLIVLKQIRSMNTIITQPDLFPFLQAFVLLLELSVIALFLATLVIL